MKRSFVLFCLFIGWTNEALAEKGYNLSARLGSDAKYILTSPLRMTTQDIKEFILFAGATYGLIRLDDKVRQEIIQPNYDQIGWLVKPVDSPRDKYLFDVVGAFCLAGGLFRDEGLKKTSMLLSEAVIFSTILTHSFKYAFGRPRPYQNGGETNEFHPFSSYNSFPSGHTSLAFTTATVISNQYPSRWVKGIAYTTAGLVGMQRLYANDHGAADVFAGAVLGIWVGKTVCRLDKKWVGVELQSLSVVLQVRF